MLNRVIISLEMRFEYIILRIVWKMDWRESGGREIS